MTTSGHCSNDFILCCADDTQDPMEDEQQLTRVTDWISCRHLDTVELTDVLSNFPDISMVKFRLFYLSFEQAVEKYS